MDAQDPKELKQWLRRLGWALAALPARDRDEIVEETRQHVLARVEQGVSLASALAALGSPDTYARGFIDEMELSGALANQKPTATLSAVARRAHRSLAAALAVILTFVLGFAAFIVVTVAVIKIGDPEHAGLWVSERGSFLGIIDDPTRAREVLGLWIYPLAAAAMLAAWALARAVLMWALRDLARRR